MKRLNNPSFLGGLVAGALVAVIGSSLLAPAIGDDDSRQRSPSFEPQVFVTGDVYGATVWQLEADGTLTCVSHNQCRQPIAAPDRIRPRDPSVPTGPRTPTGPSVPLRDRSNDRP